MSPTCIHGNDGNNCQLCIGRVDLRDTAPRQEERGGTPYPNLTRAQRRRIAKKNGLFKDRSGEAWRAANKHLKGEDRG